MSLDTADGDSEEGGESGQQGTAADRHRHRQVGSLCLRRTVEYAGLGLTALLALVMFAFVTFDWFQTLSGPLGSFGATGFEQFRSTGRWLDGLLGTRVFQHTFTLRAIATGVLVGIVGPLVGAFLVHRQMALIGETLAHTAFAGVAIGIVAVAFTGLTASQENLVLVALFVSIIAALGLQWLTKRTNSYGDVPIAIVLTGSFAVGTLLISAFRDRIAIGIEIEDFLFGDVAIVTAQGTRMVAVLTVAVVALVVLNYKQFLFITFDEQAARVARFRVDGYNSLLIVMTAVVVVGAMQILGVILVAGLLVIPAAAASQLAESFRETLYLSVLFGQVSVLGGLGIAIGWSLAAGGSIIVVAIAIYILAVLASDRSAGGLAIH